MKVSTRMLLRVTLGGGGTGVMNPDARSILGHPQSKTTKKRREERERQKLGGRFLGD